MRSARLLQVAAAAVLAGGLALGAQQPYKVLDHWKLGGDGFWDYLTMDSAAHRLYITHGQRVEVVDTTTGKPVGAVTGLKGVHGVALDAEGKFGYITDGGSSAVVVFDRAMLATVATVPTDAGPDGIVYEPVTKTVWSFNGRAKSATVISTADNKAVATVALPGRPEFPVADGKGNVFDNIEDKSLVVRIDARTFKVTAEWPAGTEGPSGLAYDAEGNRLFSVGDGGKMGILDAATGKLLATGQIGDGPDAAGWDARDKLAFASSGDGKLAVVDCSNATYKTIQMLDTVKGARTMAYDPASDRIFAATAQMGPRPAATAENPHPRPAIVPGSFEIVVIGR